MGNEKKLVWGLYNNALAAQVTEKVSLIMRPADKHGSTQFHLYPFRNGIQQNGIGTGSLFECLEWAEDFAKENG